MRYLLLLLLSVSLGIALLGISPAVAQEASSSAVNEKVQVVVFVREGCQHCRDEEAFLNTLQSKRSDITLTFYRLEKHADKVIWNEFTNRIKSSKVTPITVIGKGYIIGFDRAETTGKELERLIDSAKKDNINTDLTNPNLRMGGKTSTCEEDPNLPCTDENTTNAYAITVPFLGTIETQKYPLFVLSALLGFLDGFNPCAMWVLVTFLIILLQLGDRRKMFLFAGVFILAEAIMYTLILTVWFTAWDFVQMDSIVTPIVGLIAIGGGVFFLYEYRKKELACKVTNVQQRYHIKKRIEQLAFNKFTFLTFLGILGVAFSVNIIEFACSIGIPQSFTKILEINNLTWMQNGFAIFTYIFFYMLDDFVVFGLALWGADKLTLTTKYSKWSNLIGGAIMILLGILLLFKPALLLF